MRTANGERRSAIGGLWTVDGGRRTSDGVNAMQHRPGQRTARDPKWPFATQHKGWLVVLALSAGFLRRTTGRRLKRGAKSKRRTERAVDTTWEGVVWLRKGGKAAVEDRKGVTG